MDISKFSKQCEDYQQFLKQKSIDAHKKWLDTAQLSQRAYMDSQDALSNYQKSLQTCSINSTPTTGSRRFGRQKSTRF